jgi:hypothetical protein
MNMKHILISLLATGLITGCAPKLPPNTTLNPIAKTAVYGRQFVIAGNGVLRGLDEVMASGVLPRDVGLQILQVMKQAGEQSSRLADALKSIDASVSTADRSTGIALAKSIVAGIQKLLDDAVIRIPASAKSIVSSILATFSTLLADFNTLLPTLTAAEVRHAIPQWSQLATDLGGL